MTPDLCGYRLPVGYHDSPIIAPRAHARWRLTGKRGNEVVTGNLPPSVEGTVLKHCRCIDCRNWIGADLRCRAGIGGLAVVWATGARRCDPPPDAWHYCRDYDGPQMSTDVWVWPKPDAAIERPAPGGGGPGGGPVTTPDRPGGNRSDALHHTRADPIFKRSSTASAGVAGPSNGATACDRGGNGSEAGLFRSTARTQGKEA
jgi:hypothetical protein